jgi:ATP adenylyltransferase
MEYLWSPWRMTYIQNNKPDDACVFCLALQEPDCLENLIVWRGEHAFVILNRYPYTSGHLMVVPYAHRASLELLDSATRAEIMELATQAIQVLGEVYTPEGYNLGINIGKVAGAGVASHVHLHVVPRWGGDTNFMTSLGDTRVLPETLEDTYLHVRDAWESKSKNA